MTDDNRCTGEAVESCRDPECNWHRFDLFAALLVAADAFHSSLSMHGLGIPPEGRRAFTAVAELAAAEVFGP